MNLIPTSTLDFQYFLRIFLFQLLSKTQTLKSRKDMGYRRVKFIKQLFSNAIAFGENSDCFSTWVVYHNDQNCANGILILIESLLNFPLLSKQSLSSKQANVSHTWKGRYENVPKSS